MPLHLFPEEFQGGFSIPAFGDKGFQDVSCVIDGPPEGVGDTVDLYENLIQMPPPVGQGQHSFHPLEPDLGRKHGAKSVPPEAHRLMRDLNAALM